MQDPQPAAKRFLLHGLYRAIDLLDRAWLKWDRVRERLATRDFRRKPPPESVTQPQATNG